MSLHLGTGNQGRQRRRPQFDMNAVARSWQILGIGMGTIFGVILIFYAMVRVMLRIWRED